MMSLTGLLGHCAAAAAANADSISAKITRAIFIWSPSSF
jgi:hypothetical protein